jgi:hypothetical protein
LNLNKMIYIGLKYGKKKNLLNKNLCITLLDLKFRSNMLINF